MHCVSDKDYVTPASRDWVIGMRKAVMGTVSPVSGWNLKRRSQKPMFQLLSNSNKGGSTKKLHPLFVSPWQNAKLVIRADAQCSLAMVWKYTNVPPRLFLRQGTETHRLGGGGRQLHSSHTSTRTCTYSTECEFQRSNQAGKSAVDWPLIHILSLFIVWCNDHIHSSF